MRKITLMVNLHLLIEVDEMVELSFIWLFLTEMSGDGSVNIMKSEAED